ncbi:MAG: threonine/serine dehydratase [Myxococcaceae bacterium]|nr:threonine/serine dehydratase [Myxococcaceae bacterium]MCI0672808.1 threonine/serine dehydratase [Myxococcaceae bacterium]
MTPETNPPAPTFADVRAAAERLSGHAVRTPLLESPALNARLGGRLLVKAEPLQRTGSFKFRGALNRLLLIPDEARTRGVVAFSSGNHGQAVAAAARLLGMPAVVVMPSDAPPLKVEGTRFHGAEVVLYDRVRESREAIGMAIARERGATLVPPFDDSAVIAGQGTLGAELVEQARERGARLDSVLANCSGGGLVSGVALAVKELEPEARVYAVEPEGFDDAGRSLASGERARNAALSGSLCDALLAPTPGELTLPLMRRLLTGAFAVSDAEVLSAMRAAFEHLKLVVEPGGAAALAAVLTGKLDVRGKTVAVVCSGGNVDVATFARALAMPG